MSYTEELELRAEVESLRLQVQCLERTRQADVLWIRTARGLLLKMANVLSDREVSEIVALARKHAGDLEDEERQ